MLQQFRCTLFALFLILFIDGLGLGLIFPILAQVIIDPNATLFLQGNEHTRTLWYACIIASFFVAAFFGAAILGDISDYIGRKRALMLCLLGAVIGYFISALAFIFHSIGLLLLGRFIYGFTAGSQPIAQAAIIDLSPAAHLSKYLGLVLLAVSLGTISGPIIGACLANNLWLNWLNPAIPFYSVGALALINLFFIFRYMPESPVVAKPTKRIQITRALQIFISAFTERKVRYLALCYLLLQIGWTIYYLYIPVFLVRKYMLSAINIAVFFVLIGLGLSFGFTFLVRLLQRYRAKLAIIFGYGGCMLGILLTIIPENAYYAWLMAVPITFAFGGGYPIIIALFSKQVSSERQGWIMGITSAINAFVAGLVSLLAAAIAIWGVATPLYFAAFSIFIGCFLLSLFKQ